MKMKKKSLREKKEKKEQIIWAVKQCANRKIEKGSPRRSEKGMIKGKEGSRRGGGGYRRE